MNNKFIIPLIFLVSACGSDSDSTDIVDRSLDILGGWSSQCVVIGNSGGNSSDPNESTEEKNIYGTISIAFEINGHLTTETTEFTDETCSIQEGEKEIASALYELGDLITTDSGLYALEINITLQTPAGDSTVYGIIRADGNTLYLSEFDAENRQTSLNLSIPYFKL
jgi:hypothetical protein